MRRNALTCVLAQEYNSLTASDASVGESFYGASFLHGAVARGVADDCAQAFAALAVHCRGSV